MHVLREQVLESFLESVAKDLQNAAQKS